LFGFWLSPYSVRIQDALNLKGVEYEYYEEDLANKSHLLLQYNPVTGKVPVLVHNEKPLFESLVILEYIDETWNSSYPILPKDPLQKANARFWAKFIDEKCNVALIKTIWSLGEQHEKDRAEAEDLLKVLEAQLHGKKFFGGDGVGMVDIVGNYVAFWYRAIDEALKLDIFTEEKFPRLWQWAEDYVACAGIKENLPTKEKLIANFPPPYRGLDRVVLFRSRLLSANQ
jgi:glutathione S-transferase